MLLENRFDRSGILELQITDEVWTYYELQLTMWCDHWRPGPRPPAPSPRGPRHWPPGGRGPVPSCCPPLRLLWRGLKHQTGQQQTTENNCWEMTPANVSWWNGVKAKNLLQLRPYNIFCFQWRLRWKKLCQTVGKFLNHKSRLRWDLGDTECNDILTSKILYFG